MIGNTEQADEIAVEIANYQADDDIISMVGALTESIMMAHKIPADFDGLSLNIMRDPDTHQLMAIVITPVDTPKIELPSDDPAIMRYIDGEPVPRYKVEASNIRTADAPRIALS